MYGEYQAERDYELARKEAETERKTETQEAGAVFEGERSGEAARLPEEVFVELENPIDFNVLKEKNPDIYAWIRIPDTQIDYPIAQREGDDTFYLEHDMYGEKRFAGCIYTEECNSRDFQDPNTVIYGHNMRNGTMFQNLHLFEVSDFFEEHPYFYIYTPEEVLKYEVFAAYAYDDRHLMNSFDFNDEEVFEAYLEEIFHVRAMNANIRSGIKVSRTDRIVTLATCIGGDGGSRYLVQAVLTEDESNEEQQ